MMRNLLLMMVDDADKTSVVKWFNENSFKTADSAFFWPL